MVQQNPKKETTKKTSLSSPAIIKTGPNFFGEAQKVPISPEPPKRKRAKAEKQNETSSQVKTIKRRVKKEASTIETSLNSYKSNEKPMKKTASAAKNTKTKIVVKYDCGMPNTLFIRGEGVSTLSWEKGQPLTNTSSDEWVWETERPFTQCDFKILVNDEQFETGVNHTVTYGTTEVIYPQF